MSDRTELARRLIEIGAVQLSFDQPFEWASGILSPVYCDNRVIISNVDLRQTVCRQFAALVSTEGLLPDVVAGTATAAIPHAAWLAENLNLPMVYVRSKPKAHGAGRQIEGRIQRGDRVVLVEDLVSTGGSSLGAVAALRDAGAEVVAVLAIFSYDLPEALKSFHEDNVRLYTLTGFNNLVQAYANVNPDAARTLQDWQKSPRSWSAHISSRLERT